MFVTVNIFHFSLIFAVKTEEYLSEVPWGSTKVGFGLAGKYLTRREVTASGKHSSLFNYGFNYCNEKFDGTRPRLPGCEFFQSLGRNSSLLNEIFFPGKELQLGL